MVKNKAWLKAYRDKEAVTINLSHSQSGNDEVMLTKTQINQIKKAARENRGTNLRISKTQIRSKNHAKGLFMADLSQITWMIFSAGHSDW